MPIVKNKIVDIIVVYLACFIHYLISRYIQILFHIYYPPTTIWSDHPVVMLKGAWVTPAQKAAGDKLIAFLRSVPVQATALRFGFRPADPSVPMKTTDGNNPFLKMSQYGLSLELPPATRPPEGPVLRNLMMMWSRVVKLK